MEPNIILIVELYRMEVIIVYTSMASKKAELQSKKPLCQLATNEKEMEMLLPSRDKLGMGGDGWQSSLSMLIS